MVVAMDECIEFILCQKALKRDVRNRRTGRGGGKKRRKETYLYSFLLDHGEVVVACILPQRMVAHEEQTYGLSF